jgi:hypothetical protein
MAGSEKLQPYSKKQRVGMVKKGWAIPITNDAGEVLDGSTPIANRDDLALAIKDLPSARNKSAVKAHITKRAEALGAVDVLPGAWLPDQSGTKRRGRPVGSVSLTREREEKILGLIRGGVFDHVAAEAAGISPRTLRDLVARGEGRSSRPSTPKLRAFAKEYRKAKAEARALAEARAYRDHLLFWLSHAARSTEEREGWTEPPEGSTRGSAPSPEELRDLITGVRNDLLYTDPNILVPECLNRRCRCAFHRPRTPEELEQFRAIATRRRKRPGRES